MSPSSSWRKGVNMSRAISDNKTALTLWVALAVAASVGFGVLGGCAPQAANLANSGTDGSSQQAAQGGSEAEGETSASLANWSPDMDCSVCHDTEQASLSDSTCTASNHANLSCTDCHAEIEGLTAVHQETKKSKPGKINRLDYPVSEETCFECHESKEALAESTADCAALTDSKGTVVNPHAIPENEGHKKQAECADCHGMHKASDPSQYCLGCHHQNVYECYTCHE